jgi:hypothetical protein
MRTLIGVDVLPEASGKKGTCFVISPIGAEGSDIRRRSDQVLTHIITPVATELGYETIRADKISEPGMITSQVIQHLVEDLLVVADLSGHNPNVFYELAVRHAVRKPVVQLIQIGEAIPFDVAQTRTVQYDHRDLDVAARCRDELREHIKAIEKDPAKVDTPVSIAVDVKSLRSGSPLEKSTAEILSLLQHLNAKFTDMTSGSTSSVSTPGITFVSSLPFGELRSIDRANDASLIELRHYLNARSRELAEEWDRLRSEQDHLEKRAAMLARAQKERQKKQADREKVD